MKIYILNIVSGVSLFTEVAVTIPRHQLIADLDLNTAYAFQIYNGRAKDASFQLDVVGRVKIRIIELIFSNHLKWCAHCRATHFEQLLFLPRLLTPTNPFLCLSFSRFHIFNISAFRIPKCFNFFAFLCMRSNFQGFRLVLSRAVAAGGRRGEEVEAAPTSSSYFWKHMHPTCPPLSPLSYPPTSSLLELHFMQLHMTSQHRLTPTCLNSKRSHLCFTKVTTTSTRWAAGASI